MARSPFLPALLLLAVLTTACGDGADESQGLLLTERWYTYPVSHIFIGHEGKGPGEEMEKSIKALNELEAGTPFAEVARRYSEQKVTADKGGWLGFLLPDGSDLVSAYQALRPGMWSGPVDTEKGTQILLRHTFEEGRRIESELVIPAYGFLIPWDAPSGQGEGMGRAEAERRAREAVEKIRSGRLTVGAAAQAYTPLPPKEPDAFINLITDVPKTKLLYDRLSKARPGEVLAPFPDEKQRLTWVLERGRYYRSMVRHILIQHVGVQSRGLDIRRTRPEAEKLAEEVLTKARRPGADWDDLVRRYSDDPNTSHTSGSIGCAANGGFHYAIREVIEKTPPGQVADHLAESTDGFHILWRVN